MCGSRLKSLAEGDHSFSSRLPRELEGSERCVCRHFPQKIETALAPSEDNRRRRRFRLNRAQETLELGDEDILERLSTKIDLAGEHKAAFPTAVPPNRQYIRDRFGIRREFALQAPRRHEFIGCFSEVAQCDAKVVDERRVSQIFQGDSMSRREQSKSDIRIPLLKAFEAGPGETKPVHAKSVKPLGTDET